MVLTPRASGLGSQESRLARVGSLPVLDVPPLPPPQVAEKAHELDPGGLVLI